MARVMTLAKMAKQPKATKGTTASLEMEPIEKVLTETDEEIMARLGQRFEILEDMTLSLIHI